MIGSRDDRSGTAISLGEYFSELVPLKPNLEPDGFTGLQPCTHRGCGAISSLHKISTSWPQILTIESNLRCNDQVDNTLTFDSRFTIAIVDNHLAANQPRVTYELVGRIISKNGNHFVAHLRLGTSYYSYDDMANNGKLKKLKTSQSLEKRHTTEVYYVYVRTSTTGKTIQPGEMAQATRLNFMKTVVHGSSERPVAVSDSGSDLSYMSDPGEGNIPARQRRSQRETSKRPKSYIEPEDVGLDVFDKETNIFGDSDEDVGGLFDTKSVTPEPLIPLKQELESREEEKASKEPHSNLSDPPKSLPKSTTLTVQSCLTCGVTGPSASELIYCGICKVASHVVCVRRTLPTNFDEAFVFDFHFCCESCIHYGRWDEVMIGSFILVNIYEVIPRSTGLSKPAMSFYYPAKIIARHDKVATLKWHEFNYYREKIPQVPPTFEREVSRCFQDRQSERIMSGDPHKQAFGSIRWPLELSSDELTGEQRSKLTAGDKLNLMAAMTNALPAVVSVVRGDRFHPVSRLMEQHMAKLPGTASTLSRNNHVVEFRSLFSLPVFPGHRNLIEHFLREVNILEKIGDKRNPDEADTAAVVLMELVVLRQYFGVNSSHDGEIYELSRWLTQDEYDKSLPENVTLRGRLVRQLTDHEKAFNSINPTSPDDDSKALVKSDKLSGLATYTRQQLHLRIDDTLRIPNTSSLVQALTEQGERYIFGSYAPEHCMAMELGREEEKNVKDYPPVPAFPRSFPLTGTYRVVSSVPSTSKPTKLEQTKLNFKPTKREQQMTTTTTRVLRASTVQKRDRVGSLDEEVDVSRLGENKRGTKRVRK
ncbi:hypothetical protein CC2G_002734 [Coprinopsis cinerea AmutBmut pab1-1]|nr:hypothetical protein CC2G_002734 [Coprinopsis cinerea AmutBmut pab1-1]